MCARTNKLVQLSFFVELSVESTSEYQRKKVSVRILAES